MNRLTYLAAAAAAVLSLLSQPVFAQSGGGGNNSRGAGRRPSATTSPQRGNGSSDKTYTAPQNSDKSRAQPGGDERRRQPARTGSNAPGRREQATQPSGRPGGQSQDNGRRPGGQYGPGGQHPSGRPGGVHDNGNRPGQMRPGEGRPGGQSRPGNQGRPDNQNRPGYGNRPGRPDMGNRPPQGHPGYGGPHGHGRPDVRPGGGWRPEPGRVPPPHRSPISYRRPSRFWDSGDHYFGYRVKRLPLNYGRREYFGVSYYVLNDVFYRYVDGSYYVCRPPFGVAFMPARFGAVSCSFAFYFASYRNYRTYNDVARYVTDRNALVASGNSRLRFSSGNAQRAYESYLLADRLGLVQSFAAATADYYYEDGVFFVRTSGGEYVTVVPPAGALVVELPDDYRVIYLDGVEYYAVDYTVYRAVALDGNLYFEVLGQMTDGYSYY